MSPVISCISDEEREDTTRVSPVPLCVSFFFLSYLKKKKQHCEILKYTDGTLDFVAGRLNKTVIARKNVQFMSSQIVHERWAQCWTGHWGRPGHLSTEGQRSSPSCFNGAYFMSILKMSVQSLFHAFNADLNV